MPAKADSTDAITAIYDINTKLETAVKSNDTTQITSLQSQYKSLINYVTTTSTDQIKQLCADFIPRYVHLYTDLTDLAINKQFDLCEDNSSIVRIHAIKGLEHISKNLSTQISRCADILCQLLITDENHELAAVKQTLTALCNIDLRSTLTTLFTQLNAADDTNLKQRILEFTLNILTVKRTVIQGNTELKNVIAHGFETYLTNNATSITDTEFDHIFTLYVKLVKLKDKEENAVIGTKIEHILLQYVQLDSFDITNESSVKRFCTALSYINKNSTNFNLTNSTLYSFFMTHILPVIDSTTPELQYSLYRNLATSSRYIDQTTAKQSLQPIYTHLQQYLPSTDTTVAPQVNYTIIEFVLYTFHIVAQRAKSVDITKQVCGLFQPTGQPNESLTPEQTRQRDTFLAQLTRLQQITKEFILKSKAVETNLTQVNKTADKDAKQANWKIINDTKAAIRAGDSILKLIKPLLSKTPTFIEKHWLSYQTKQINEENAKATGTQSSKGTKQQQSGHKRKSTDNTQNTSGKRQSTGKSHTQSDRPTYKKKFQKSRK